jgi:hypothetical protein
MSNRKKAADEHEKEPKPATGSVVFPLKYSGETVVKHEDMPPPAGKTRIQPRRPLPPVPTREERTAQESEDTDTGKPRSC